MIDNRPNNGIHHINYADSPSAFSYQRLSEGASIVDISIHDDCIIFILSGALNIIINGGDKKTYRSQSMILLPGGDRCHISANQETEIVLLKSYGLYFCSDKIANIEYRNIINNLNSTEHSLQINEPLSGLLNSIVYYLDTDLYSDDMHATKLHELSNLFFSLYSTEEICHFFYPLLIKGRFDFCSKVLANHNVAKNVIELSQLCGYSLSNFNKLFSKYFNQPPYRWMQQQKVPEIRNRLANNSIPIKAIVTDFGFSDQSCLNAFCKQYMGATPMQIRKMDESSKKVSVSSKKRCNDLLKK